MESEIEHSLEAITSGHAFSIPDNGSRRKWDGPWWQMAVLCEMGESHRIPQSAAMRALEQLKHGAWPRFVVTSEDAPTSPADRAKMDCCHCELGVLYKVLSECGCDVDAELPWMREWFLKHQLSDGGLNCTPDAYRNSRKSSIVSTLPPLEAVLFHTKREFTEAEMKFLDEGARYLIEHRLVCSTKDGSVINGEWLKPMFPRFFEYDIMRGLYYLVEWAKRRGKPLPVIVIQEGIGRISKWIEGSGVVLGRDINDKDGDWPGRSFPLLRVVSKTERISPYLEKELKAVAAAVS